MKNYFNTLSVHISIQLNGWIPGALRYEMLSTRAYRCSEDFFVSGSVRKWYWFFVFFVIDAWFAFVLKQPEHCKSCYDTQVKELNHIWKLEQ